MSEAMKQFLAFMEPVEERVKTVVSTVLSGPVSDEVLTRQPERGGNVFASGALIADADVKSLPLPKAA